MLNELLLVGLSVVFGCSIFVQKRVGWFSTGKSSWWRNFVVYPGGTSRTVEIASGVLSYVYWSAAFVRNRSGEDFELFPKLKTASKGTRSDTVVGVYKRNRQAQRKKRLSGTVDNGKTRVERCVVHKRWIIVHYERFFHVENFVVINRHASYLFPVLNVRFPIFLIHSWFWRGDSRPPPARLTCTRGLINKYRDFMF